MNVDEFLAHGGTSIEAICRHVREEFGECQGDMLFAVGSLVEGFGNSRSDLDLFLITPRKSEVLPERDEFIWSSGSCVIDLRVFSQSKIKSLLERLRIWVSRIWDTSNVAPFSHEERVLLHRLSKGKCISVDSSDNNSADGYRLSSKDVSLLKLHVARHAGKTILVDMAGYEESKNYQSLGFAAIKLLGHAIDALLACQHFSNPLTKWRSQYLSMLPENWEKALVIEPTGIAADDFFWRMCRLPPKSDKDSVLAYAKVVVGFARAVFVSAESSLVYGNVERFTVPSDHWGISRITDHSRVYNSLDMDFMLRENTVKVARLNMFELSKEMDDTVFIETFLSIAPQVKEYLGDLKLLQKETETYERSFEISKSL